jgi:hypothetical protein
MKYSVVSKQANKEGRNVLVSFASAPIFKTYSTIIRHNTGGPGYWDKKTANYALETYANKDGYEVVETSEIEKEIKSFTSKLH